MILGKILAAMLCMCTILSMLWVLTISFFKKGDSGTIIDFFHGPFPESPKERILCGLIILAAIGFCVSLFQGIESLLFWIPDYFRTGDGEETLRENLSYLISGTMFIFAMGAFVVFISSTFANRPLLIKVEELERILKFSDSKKALTSMKNEYENKIKCLTELSDDTLKYRKSRQISIEGPRSYEQYTELSKPTLSLLIAAYQELIWHTEQVLNKLEKPSV